MTTRDPSPEAIERQLERILASRHFRGARGPSAILAFVVRRTLAGDATSLKEYTLGAEVLGRGADYDPKADGVVRVQAGALRKKLAAYYGDEGRADEVVIDVPKGGYVPTFEVRAPGPAAPVPPPRRRLSPALAAAGALAVAAAALALALARPAAAPDGPAATPVWEGFLDGDAPALLVLGTPQFFASPGGMLLRDTRVNTPQAGSERLRTVEEALGHKLRPVEVYTGIGEANAAVDLAQLFARAGRELRVVRSRLVGWEDLKQANVIFLSSMRFHTLADELSYRSDFVFAADEGGRVLNRRPLPGEEASYGGDGDDHDHAVVTLWPGKLPGRRIMVVGGRTTWGTQGAAEYLARPEYRAELAARLEECRRRAGLQRHPPHFQILLRVEVRDAQPLRTTWVTHHDLEPPG